jgi:hypothetical protein
MTEVQEKVNPLDTNIAAAKDAFASKISTDIEKLQGDVLNDIDITGLLDGTGVQWIDGSKMAATAISGMLLWWSHNDIHDKVVDYLTHDGFGDNLSDKMVVGKQIDIALQQFGEEGKKLAASVRTAQEKFDRVATQSDLDALRTELWFTSPDASTYTREESDDHIADDDDHEASNVVPENSEYPAFTLSVDGFPEFENKAKILYNEIVWEKPAFEVFLPSYLGFINLQKSGKIKKTTIMTIVDYNQSRQSNRWYTIDLSNKKTLYNAKVWHGLNSGDNYATQFGNEKWSFKTSLWFYITPDAITPAHTKKWQWLWMSGVDADYNDDAHARGIYVHKWWVKWSQGCFTLPEKSQEIMEDIKWGSAIFAYSSQWDYLKKSIWLQDVPKDLVA